MPVTLDQSTNPFWPEYVEAWHEQREVDALLNKGVIFSLVWLAGLGSLYSVICGVRAWRLRQRSRYQLRGTKRCLWCLIVGGGGSLFLLWVCVTFIMYLFGYDAR